VYARDEARQIAANIAKLLAGFALPKRLADPPFFIHMVKLDIALLRRCRC
jgi:hypothetical protein